MRRARDRFGRYLPRRKAAAPARRRVRRYRRRRNPVAVVNAPRRYRRRYARRSSPARRVRRYRRNPPAVIMGMPVSLTNVAYTVGGLVGASYLEGILSGILPAQITENKIGKYAVKIGSALGLAYFVRLFDRKAVGPVMVGGMANVAIALVGELTGIMLPRASASRYLASQPLLAEYPSLQGLGATAITANVPERLDPASRF